MRANDAEAAQARWHGFALPVMNARLVAVVWASQQNHVVCDVGSGVPVRFRGRHLIATASHVLERPRHDHPCYGPLLWYRQVSTGDHHSHIERIQTVADGSALIRQVQRQQKTFDPSGEIPRPDVGFLELADASPLTEAGVEFVDLPRLSADHDGGRYNYWALAGWPAARIKPLRGKGDRAEAWTMLAYEGCGSADSEDDMHIELVYAGKLLGIKRLACYDPLMSNLSGEDIYGVQNAPPDLYGVSGGPLWMTQLPFPEGSIVSPECFRLAGLQSSWDPSVDPPRLRVTRIRQWVEFAAQYFPGTENQAV